MPATTSALMALRLSGRLMVIQSACPRFSRITLLWSVIVPLACLPYVGKHLRQDRGGLQGRFKFGGGAVGYFRNCASLLHPSSLEKSRVGGVLLDVGSIALLCRILNVLVSLRGVLVHLGIVGSTLMTTIGGRRRRHFIVTRHLISLRARAHARLAKEPAAIWFQ